MTTTTPWQAVAEELAESFERASRDDGTRYTKVRDDAPDWIDTDLMRELHQAVDDRMPNDWIYEQIAAIASAMHEYGQDNEDDARDDVSEIADGLVDIYYSDLTKWLADHGDIENAALCDEAVLVLGEPEGNDIHKRIMLGQYMALDRLANAIIQAITDEADGREE